MNYIPQQLLLKGGESASQVSGKIILSSERYFCESCQDIIKKFIQKFPKITLELQAGPKIPEERR